MTILGTIWSAATLPPLGNDRRTRKARTALAKKQRADAKLLCLASSLHLVSANRIPARRGPMLVTLTRVFIGHGRSLDDDNLRATFKHVRDGIADWLGVDDSARSGIEWRYEQRRWDSICAYAPNSKAEWWATFETHAKPPERTDDLSATIHEARAEKTLLSPDEMPGTCDRLTIIRDRRDGDEENILTVDNASKHRITVEASVVPGLVRVVIR